MPLLFLFLLTMHVWFIKSSSSSKIFIFFRTYAVPLYMAYKFVLFKILPLQLVPLRKSCTYWSVATYARTAISGQVTLNYWHPPRLLSIGKQPSLSPWKDDISQAAATLAVVLCLATYPFFVSVCPPATNIFLAAFFTAIERPDPTRPYLAPQCRT